MIKILKIINSKILDILIVLKNKKDILMLDV